MPASPVDRARAAIVITLRGTAIPPRAGRLSRLGDGDGMFGHDLEGAVLEDGDDAAAHALSVGQVEEDRVAWLPSGSGSSTPPSMRALGLWGPGSSCQRGGARAGGVAGLVASGRVRGRDRPLTVLGGVVLS